MTRWKFSTEHWKIAQAVVVRAFNPHLGVRGREISEFEANLVCSISSRTARATQRNLVSKNITKQNKKLENINIKKY